ncbi:MAG TPA: excinuclease ABC subunit UvrC [Bacteroidales bacterium]|nr:excinuclease ABC subunit UvrC [Bacteroidales bacterium]HPO65054.1 excinuclease ABC subunit UvrC [Bacteroidales bacterium]
MISITRDNTDFLGLLPTSAGVYLFYDGAGTVLYVGKAKNLKSRVSSYFSSSVVGAKTRLLVARAALLDYIVVNNESEALLLENTLIKKYKPRYNILLKDDKTYPWVVIRNEPFPRVMLTRRVVNDGSSYFGPFTSAYIVRNLLTLLKQLYPLRTCNLDLTPDKIAAGNFKVCLDYHIGICKGPCVGLQSEEDYQQNVSQIKNILQGKISAVKRLLQERMQLAAQQYQYEYAHELKEKIALLEKYHNDSLVVNPRIRECDVISFARQEEMTVVNYLHVVEGALVHTYNAYFQVQDAEEIPDLIGSLITQIRTKFASTAPEILVTVQPNFKLNDIRYIVPKTGDRRKLLELSLKNANAYLQFLIHKMDKASQKENTALQQLKSDLGLRQLPTHIECFDNSNIQGQSPVSACVVFRNGVPAKSEYRHFHVKTVEGPDDYATMREIVYRRYRRLLDEDGELPQLIVIDGGKGQLNAAIEALKLLNIEQKVEIISIAKRLEEIYRPGDSLPIYLDKRSPSLRLIQQLRDEAHRFGITFHRRTREKRALSSFFDTIEGIGDKTKQKLLKKYGSIEAIRMASVDELTEMVGEKKARQIQAAFEQTFEF